MVGFVRPLRIDRFAVGEQRFNLLLAHVLKRPSQHSHLFAHVVDVILGRDPVAPQTMQADEGVAQDGVSRSADVKRSVGVGRSVFDEHFPPGFMPRLAVLPSQHLLR